MEHLVQPILAFAAAHARWAAVVLFVTSFGESFVFLSLFFPGTTLLIAAGALVSAGALPIFPVVAGAVLGAVLGDTVSFWIGRRFGPGVSRIWPFARNPRLLENAIRFFNKHGGKSVFIGRFFGPLRSVVPLAAGILAMPSDRFWFANIASAVVWAPLLLFAGELVGKIGARMLGSGNPVLVLAVGAALAAIGGAVWLWARSRRRSGGASSDRACDCPD